MNVTYRFESVSPLLMNSPASMLVAPESGAKMKNIPSPEEESEASTYRMPSGQLYFPALAFRRAAIDAGTGRRIQKRAATAVLKGALFVGENQGLEVPLFDHSGDPITEYVIDIQRAVLGGKTAVRRARPRLDEWAGEITFEIDTDHLNEKIVLEMLSLAGKSIGVGNYRPQKGGPYGRFRVL